MKRSKRRLADCIPSFPCSFFTALVMVVVWSFADHPDALAFEQENANGVEDSESSSSHVDSESEAATALNWRTLRNPILAEPDRLLKDPSVVYHDGWFYIFTHKNYRSRDLQNFEVVERTGSQPDVTWSGDEWVMAKNGGRLPDWDEEGSAAPRFHTSQDLLHWGPVAELLPGLTEARNIDPAIAWEDGHAFVGFKRHQNFYMTRMAAGALGSSDYEPIRRASAGGLWAEQFQFIKIDGEWRMIATARRQTIWDMIMLGFHPYTGNHHPFIYRKARQGNNLGSWTEWVERRELKIPRERWNKAMHANGGFLLDMRQVDGYFYLFYAGSADHTSFDRRGHDKIGVARSRNLIKWVVPGDMSAAN